MAGVNTKHANRLGGESLRLDSAATCRYVLGTSCWKFLLKWLIRLEDQVVARDGFGLNYTRGFPLATMLLPRPETGVTPLL
jgi:hypothetical protein